MTSRFSGLRKLALILFALPVAILILGALYTAYAEHQAELEFPARGEFLNVSTGKLHYTDASAGDAIVLLHGASSNLREFESSLQPLFAKRYRVLSFDRPGYGYSERDLSNWPTPADQARAVHEALQRLGVRRPVLVGHSWSGSVVMAYALAYPNDTRAVVSLAGGTHSWKGGVAWHVSLAQQPILGEIFARTVVMPLGQLIAPSAANFVFWPEHPPINYANKTGMQLAIRPSAFRSSAQDIGQLSEFLKSQSPQYPNLQVPVLVFTGTHDHVVPGWNHATRVIRQYPQAQLQLLQGAGHGLHHTRADVIVERVNAFLERHP